MVNHSTPDFRDHHHHQALRLNHHSPFIHFNSSPPLVTPTNININQDPWALPKPTRVLDGELDFVAPTNKDLEERRDTATPGTKRVRASEDQHASSCINAITATNSTMVGTSAEKERQQDFTQQIPRELCLPVFKPLPMYIENKFVNILRFSELLDGYPDGRLVHFVLNRFMNGFNLGFRGSINEQPLRNNKSARDNPEKVSEAISKEVERGHISGPFTQPPFPHCHVSPLGAAPKPDGSCRLILDLSQPSGDSVNDNIQKTEFPCNYTHFDAATDLVFRIGRGCYLTKIDIKHAYRLLPVRREDWPLLVYFWNGCYYVDVVLPFGGRSSASIFTSFADLVCWVLNNKFHLIVIHYSDDYLMFTRNDLMLAHENLRTLKKAFRYLNIPVASDKLVGPATQLPYLGIEINTMDFTVSIPLEKVNELMEQMPWWCGRRTCTLKELQSLNGKLGFFSKAIRPGRMFTRRLIDLTKTVKKQSHYVTLTREARDDIHWWCELLLTENRSSFIPDPKKIYSTDLMLFTDAAKYKGMGAVYGPRWIQASWPSHFQERSIDFLELFAIVAAARTWGHTWKGRRVVFVTDNLPIVQIWDKTTTPSPDVMDLVRKLYLHAAISHFTVSFKHILTHHNPIADALSRFQMDRFRRLMPDADPHPTPIPVDVWNLGNHLERARASDN